MKKTNLYFLISGILEIIAAVSYFFMFLICIMAYSDCAGLGVVVEEGAEVDYSAIANVLLFLSIFVLVACAISAFLAWIFLKHRTLTYEQMHEKSGLMITGIVLCFLFGGILVGVLALVGYSNKEKSSDEAQIVTATSEDLEEKLNKLKKMLDDGTITQEEYDQARKDAINKF